jgi:hypothetical protein
MYCSVEAMAIRRPGVAMISSALSAGKSVRETGGRASIVWQLHPVREPRHGQTRLQLLPVPCVIPPRRVIRHASGD